MKKILLTSVLLLSVLCAFAQGNSKGGTHRGHTTPYTQPRASSWSGSGIAIDAKYIATNHHVVDGATNLSIYFPEQDKEYRAEVITVDETHDLAIIKVTDPEFSGFNNIKYGFKNEVEDVGMGVFVLGYPLVQSMGTEIKLTTGVVSSRSGYQGDKSQYQISAPVQPGNSGGPLFNDNGELIGIVSAKHSEAENVSYGVKLSHLTTLASQIQGLNLNRSTQLANLSLSEKCKSVIPCTVMVLANNGTAAQSQVTQTSSADQKQQGQQASNSYPIRVNKPKITRSGDTAVRIYGIEATEKYTAIYMSWTNTQYHGGWYHINKDSYISDPKTGKKYALKTTDNCAITPEKTTIELGQTKEFTLYFEPIPATTTVIDIIEPGNSNWKFYGIELQ